MVRSLSSPRTLALAALLLGPVGCGPEALEEEHDESGHPEEGPLELGTQSEGLTAAGPVPGHRITTPFGRAGSWAAGYHTGDDYAAPTGTRVVATRAGRVVHAGTGGWGAAYGIHVIVETGRVRHLYAHLSRTSVRAGASVGAGQELGRVGSTGRSTGPHLHYEERTSPFGYYDHRRPVLNKSAPPSAPSRPSAPSGGRSSGGGYLNWVLGRDHDDVPALQRALIDAGCPIPAALTTHYGAQTRDAVACFQRKQGWRGSGADGLMGPRTAERLWLVGEVWVDRLHGGVSDSDSVRRLQRRLNEVIDARLPVTGHYGPSTRDAVARWQRSIGDRGSAADGNMGPRQSRRLFPSHRYRIR